MKTSLNLKSAMVAIVSLVLFGFSCRAEDAKEKTQIEKSQIVDGDEKALEAARKYMLQGARWISIHPKMFDDTKGRWEVEATFYVE